MFYPFDFSPVCTTELCEFRDAEFLTFTEAVDVVGLSGDSARTVRYAWSTEDAYENPDLVAIYETLKTIGDLDFGGDRAPSAGPE